MTDHLEPFRRMVRSIRFVPPTWRTQPSQHVVEQQTNTLQLGSWIDTNRTTAESVADPGPTPDPSEHIASLVRDAVSKRTVLPVTYTIAENIGDRISRLAIPKPVIPEYIPPQPVYSDNNYTLAVVPQHTESEGQIPSESSPTADVRIDAVAPELFQLESEGTPQAETSPTEESVSIDAVASKILKPESEGAPQAETSPTEESVSIDAVAPELFKVEEAIEELSEANTVEAQPSQLEADLTPASTPVEQADTPAPTPEETKPSNLLEEVVAAIKPVVDGVVAAVEPVVEAVLSPLQPSVEPQVQPSESPEVSCPKCQSTQVRKKGHYKDKQRYVCKDCGKQFMLPESLLNQAQQITANSIASSDSDNTAEAETSLAQKANKTTKSSSPQSKTKKKAKGFGSDKSK